MMAQRSWHVLHRWSSLACTAFLLVLCVTGLPLIFGDEIDQWLDGGTAYASLPPDAPRVSLDLLVTKSLARYPGQIVTSVFIDDDEPKIVISMAPSWKLSKEQPKSNHSIRFDARTAQLIGESGPLGPQRPALIQLVRRLHVDLFAGLPGMLFLGLMGLLFVIAIVTGVVLYGPFMKKLEFGTIRSERSSRLGWLDLHNLLGIVTLAWALVVGITGSLNEISTPLFMLWQRIDVQTVLRARHGAILTDSAEPRSLQAAVDTAQRALPDEMKILTIAYPGGPLGSADDYLMWARGNTPVTSRLFTPILVAARGAATVMQLPMPWYLWLLQVSRPLHFGDYGGMPLRILWVFLDLITIAVLGSGLYLWFARRAANAMRTEKLRGSATPEGFE